MPPPQRPGDEMNFREMVGNQRLRDLPGHSQAQLEFARLTGRPEAKPAAGCTVMKMAETGSIHDIPGNIILGAIGDI